MKIQLAECRNLSVNISVNNWPAFVKVKIVTLMCHIAVNSLFTVLSKYHNFNKIKHSHYGQLVEFPKSNNCWSVSWFMNCKRENCCQNGMKNTTKNLSCLRVGKTLTYTYFLEPKHAKTMLLSFNLTCFCVLYLERNVITARVWATGHNHLSQWLTFTTCARFLVPDCWHFPSDPDNCCSTV